MRQIDNMTPQEIETLRLKGMLGSKTTSAEAIIRQRGIEARGMTYDKQCLELAESFISDSNAEDCCKAEISERLAKEIQRTIEDFMAGNGLDT